MPCPDRSACRHLQFQSKDSLLPHQATRAHLHSGLCSAPALLPRAGRHNTSQELLQCCVALWLRLATPLFLRSQRARVQDTSKNDPRKRLRRFFETLYACLAKGARAVLQVGRGGVECAEERGCVRPWPAAGVWLDVPAGTAVSRDVEVP